jgi:hypothetical protein
LTHQLALKKRTLYFLACGHHCPRSPCIHVVWNHASTPVVGEAR